MAAWHFFQGKDRLMGASFHGEDSLFTCLNSQPIHGSGRITYGSMGVLAFFLRGRSSLPTPKKRNNTSPKTQYTRTLQGVSNELPHTTYRLPLGTPWRLLVSNPFYLLKSCPFPMTTPSSEVKPTSRAFSDQRLVGHQSSSQHVRGRPDLSM